MTAKRKIRIMIDIVMTVMLPFLMAYQLIGEAFHEWLGAGMCLLFICHHVLNGLWYRNVLKGRYHLLRITGTIINILLSVIIMALMISGIMMSKHIFHFGYIGSARIIHLLASYWGFVLMSVHLGLHWSMMLIMLKRALKIEKDSIAGRIILRTITIFICFYGIGAFINRQLGTYMLLQSEFVFFDFDEPIIFFIVDYFAVMYLFVEVGYYVSVLLKIKGKRKES